jgi:hypothetical protein
MERYINISVYSDSGSEFTQKTNEMFKKGYKLISSNQFLTNPDTGEILWVGIMELQSHHRSSLRKIRIKKDSLDEDYSLFGWFHMFLDISNSDGNSKVVVELDDGSVDSVLSSWIKFEM